MNLAKYQDLFFKAMHTQIALVLVLALVNVAIIVSDITLNGCMDNCGNVSIPYPFGVGTSKETSENCFLEDKMNLTCQNNNLYLGVNLLVLEHVMDVLFYVSKICNTPNRVANDLFLRTPSNFTISSKENNFISVGCETYGYLNSFNNGVQYSTECLTRCSKFPNDVVTNGDCSGIGCYEVDIPPNMKNITIEAYRFDVSSNYFQSCGHSFAAKRGSYSFDISHLENLQFDTIPMVVDWSVGDELGCEDFRKGFRKGACMNNSYCHDIDISYGYQCKCEEGYDGNPYHPNGFQGNESYPTLIYLFILNLKF